MYREIAGEIENKKQDIFDVICATRNNYSINRQIVTFAVRPHLPQTPTPNTDCVFNAKSLKDILAHAKIPSLINIIISEDEKMSQKMSQTLPV